MRLGKPCAEVASPEIAEVFFCMIAIIKLDVVFILALAAVMVG